MLKREQSTALRRIKSARSNSEKSSDRTPAPEQRSPCRVPTTFTDGHCGRTTAVQEHGITRAQLRELFEYKMRRRPFRNSEKQQLALRIYPDSRSGIRPSVAARPYLT